MIIDTSALLAILLAEPEADRLVRAIAASPVRMIGAPTLVEASAVLLARRGRPAEIALDALLQRLDIVIVPMSPEAATFGRAAYQRFGKGVGSPGILNYGDCLAYGIAMSMRLPLLYKGDDFAHTDVAMASY